MAARTTDASDAVVAATLAAWRIWSGGRAGDPARSIGQLVRLREADVKVVLAFAQNLAAGWELRFGDTGRAGTRAAEALAAARPSIATARWWPPARCWPGWPCARQAPTPPAASLRSWNRVWPSRCWSRPLPTSRWTVPGRR